jgi:hypothetical protein
MCPVYTLHMQVIKIGRFISNEIVAESKEVCVAFYLRPFYNPNIYKVIITSLSPGHVITVLTDLTDLL